MTRWTSSRVAEVIGAMSPGSQVFKGIGTDTRALVPGALFVALRGERFDGHDFLAAARAAGALGAVVRRGTEPVDGLVLFHVDDTLAALGRLAAWRRREVRGPVVAVTGTNGKTATRAMLAATLASRMRVHATRDNLNNLIGVPLTILGAPDAAEALVVECGTSVPGEIARLRDIVQPTVGVVTNVSHAHLEGFRDLAGVLREKISLLHGLPFAVVGTAPPELVQHARREADKVTSAGLEEPADVRPERWRLDAGGRVELVFRGHAIHLPVIGRHQGDNAMLAVAVAAELELELRAVAEALAHVTVPHGRCEILRAGKLMILHDAYNANPASLRAALDTARRLQGRRRLVVLVGSMLELGAESRRLHEEMAEVILAAEPVVIGALGEFAAVFKRWVKRSAKGPSPHVLTAADADELGRAIAERLHGDELVVLKASRGMQLERALRYLAPDKEVPCSTTS